MATQLLEKTARQKTKLICDAEMDVASRRGVHGRSIPSTFARAAFPLGGIGTGTVSLGARGELRDWELANSPAKGRQNANAFFAIHEPAIASPEEAGRGLRAALEASGKAIGPQRSLDGVIESVPTGSRFLEPRRAAEATRIDLVSHPRRATGPDRCATTCAAI